MFYLVCQTVDVGGFGAVEDGDGEADYGAGFPAGKKMLVAGSKGFQKL